MSIPEINVGRLVTREKYRSERSNLFARPQSFDWFVRENRAELVEAGAIVNLAGKIFVDPVRTDAAVADIGRRATEASLLLSAEGCSAPAVKVPVPAPVSQAAPVQLPVKRGRGRPRKVRPEEVAA